MIGVLGILLAYQVMVAALFFDVRHDACRKVVLQCANRGEHGKLQGLAELCTDKHQVGGYFAALAVLLIALAFVVGRRVWRGAE